MNEAECWLIKTKNAVFSLAVILPTSRKIGRVTFPVWRFMMGFHIILKLKVKWEDKNAWSPKKHSEEGSLIRMAGGEEAVTAAKTAA